MTLSQPLILSAVLLSLRIAALSTLLTGVLGTLLARKLSQTKKTSFRIIETLVVLPMVLPPSIVGYLLLLSLGKNSWLGGLIYAATGKTLLFSWPAAVIAAVIVSLPLMYQSARAGFQGVDQRLENAARTLGANEWHIFTEITLPLAKPKLLTGLALSFARAIGEFGATLMVAGNIPGKTQTIPTALYFAAEGGDHATANALMMISLFIGITAMFSVNFILDKSRTQ
jgi:molybdate transport system permease protein